MRSPTLRLTVAGAAVIAVAYGMGRYAFGLTLPSLRADPALSTGGLDDAVLGVIASGSFFGYLAGLLLAPVVGRRWGPRAPTTVGNACGLVGGALAAAATSPVVLAVGVVLAGSAAGWVWAAYSDLAAVVVDPPARPRTLAVISTGTSAGLVVSAVVGLAVLGVPGWRLVWVAIGLASLAVGLLNLRWTPRVPPTPRSRTGRLALRGLTVPIVYAVAFHVGVTTFLTWAADMLRRAALAPGWAPTMYGLIGMVGLVGLGVGGWCARFGTVRVAAACLLFLGASLVILGAGAGSGVVALVAATFYAPGIMGGAAVLAVWTAEIAPERAGEALTVVVAVGAVAAVVAPTIVGLLLGAVSLAAILVGLAVLLVLTAAYLVTARTGSPVPPP
ncbi:MFS transporter [Actinomycetospora straminea]|uniref:Major facilitator superfamily (MFS) profile domain-containing protein n=1 Tax=Actinomycetospora straminea TaxID=663607 RepID=A0ABP9EBK5_9PSEU|nr:MFS transporter [Actinomycetospora straminea]MDD7932156.1 MFS transporter [Actinomycetospora straminea]